MFAPGYATVIPPMVSVFNRATGWVNPNLCISPASATWESANRTVYYPLLLRAPCVVRRVWWANGATVSGGANIAVGVYSDSGYGPGGLLVSGTAVQGTASQVQFVDATDTALAPGLYWIAVASDSATNTTMFRSGIGSGYEAGYRFQEAAGTLPATATPVESSGTTVWLCGFSTTASP